MTTLTGTMLVPGVSGNGRLYTAELIRKAYSRLTERLSDGAALPVTMMTHHAAGDDSKEIVGRITGVAMDGDNLTYTAELAPTEQAKTIENLVKPGPNGQPFLKSTSIRGWWLGPVETVTYQGQQATTAADMEIDGLDFTKNPGVAGASVAIASESAAEESLGRTLISETVTAQVEFTETLQEAAVTTVEKATFGDPGYLGDKIRRLPLSDRSATETSWARIHDRGFAEQYTAPQLKRIKGRIKESLRKHGVDMTEIAGAAGSEITEHEVRLSEVTECYDCYDTVGTAGFSIAAYNGPLTVTVSAYDGIEPKDLAGVAQAAMKAAIDAVHAMDPDDDGDVDTGTTEDNPDDNNMESTSPKEATVAETQAPVAETTTTETQSNPAAPEIDYDKLAEAVSKRDTDKQATTETGTVSAATTEETAPTAVTETAEQIRERLKAEVTAEVVREMRTNGTLGRKGRVVAKIGESSEPAKPLHEMSEEEFAAYRNQTLEAVIPLGEH